jgi:hypothetical protein
VPVADSRCICTWLTASSDTSAARSAASTEWSGSRAPEVPRAAQASPAAVGDRRSLIILLESRGAGRHVTCRSLPKWTSASLRATARDAAFRHDVL